MVRIHVTGGEDSAYGALYEAEVIGLDSKTSETGGSQEEALGKLLLMHREVFDAAIYDLTE